MVSPNLHNDVYDAALDELATATAVHACTAEPANHAGIAAVSVGNYTLTAGDGNGDWTIAGWRHFGSEDHARGAVGEQRDRDRRRELLGVHRWCDVAGGDRWVGGDDEQWVAVDDRCGGCVRVR